MSRRSEPAHKIDERTFAVRVRFTIPEGGLSGLNDLYAWLRERAPHDYAIHSAKAGTRHCGALHLNDPKLAAECVETFGLEVAALPKLTP